MNVFHFIWFPVLIVSISNADYKQLSDVLAVALPTVAFGSSLYLGDTQGQKDFAYSLGANLAVTTGLKYAIHTTRPDGGAHSFPSGHTSITFQSAAFVHRRYGFRYALPMYAGAVLTGYSRVRAHRHYVRDVVAGAAIGTLFGYALTKPFHGVEIMPGTRRTSLGVTLRKSW